MRKIDLAAFVVAVDGIAVDAIESDARDAYRLARSMLRRRARLDGEPRSEKLRRVAGRPALEIGSGAVYLLPE